jgi:REP element-mobilizing transposase RayT
MFTGSNSIGSTFGRSRIGIDSIIFCKVWLGKVAACHRLVWDRVYDPVRPEGPSRMQPRYEYRRRLPHYQKDDHPLFVTFTTFHRWILPVPARRLVLDCCLKENGVKIELHAAVVMPDHVHLIYSPLRREDGWSYSLPEVVHAIKGRSARLINVALRRSGHVWQEECFDHVLRSNDRLVDRVEYVCLNPVRARLVRNEAEYEWSWKGRVPVL